MYRKYYLLMLLFTSLGMVLLFTAVVGKHFKNPGLCNAANKSEWKINKRPSIGPASPLQFITRGNLPG